MVVYRIIIVLCKNILPVYQSFVLICNIFMVVYRILIVLCKSILPVYLGKKVFCKKDKKR